ncbi:PKD domain-containing protein, partial [Candidatus Falkowbacteria bacterium]|nr:PKD domain-containing protein [Candidatus Falkowbacteria bacterium]
LGWIFSDPDSGQGEYAYQIIVNTSNSIVSPVFDSGQCFGYNNPTNKCVIDIGVGQFQLNSAITLNYNTPYYWWVKVWDNSAAHKDSTLAQYNSAQDTPIEADDGSPLTFTAYKHEMPDASFIYFPINPSRSEEVRFTDTSKVYLISAPSTPVNCTDALCGWSWSATAGATFKDNDIATSSPTITFNSAGNSTVTLTVTDSDGYSVSYQEVININTQLPKWKEVKPE